MYLTSSNAMLSSPAWQDLKRGGFSQEGEQPLKVYYARYADTILLGIPRIPNFFNAARPKEHAWTILKNYCDKLDLNVWWEELTSDKLIIFLVGKKISISGEKLNK
jgi:hypothetical protein